MENMEREYRSLFRDVSPSVVVVEQVGRIDYFCIGSVIRQCDKTIILTQSKILNPSVSLSVRFFDGRKQEATLLLVRDRLCVLMTNFYPKCKEVEFFEGDIDHIFAAAIAPASKCSVYNIPGFIIQKSLDVGCETEAGSSSTKHQFTFGCLYGDKSANKVSRLMSGPVFNMDHKVVGIVMDDMLYKMNLKDMGFTVQGNNLEYAELGYDLKISMSGQHLQSLLGNWFQDKDWKAGLNGLLKKVINETSCCS